jgi:hypothetical protein
VGLFCACPVSETLSLSVGNPEGKRPLGRPRRRWEDNIRMIVMETEWKIVGLVASGSG